MVSSEVTLSPLSLVDTRLFVVSLVLVGLLGIWIFVDSQGRPDAPGPGLTTAGVTWHVHKQINRALSCFACATSIHVVCFCALPFKFLRGGGRKGDGSDGDGGNGQQCRGLSGKMQETQKKTVQGASMPDGLMYVVCPSGSGPWSVVRLQEGRQSWSSRYTVVVRLVVKMVVNDWHVKGTASRTRAPNFGSLGRV